VAALGVERQDADEDERRPEQQVQRQLHRGVFLGADAVRPIAAPKMPCGLTKPGGSPDADERYIGSTRNLVEEEEDEEVERDEPP